MKTSVVSVRTEITERTAGPRRRIDHRRLRTWFFSGIASTLLLIVLIGFGRTFYLRSFFDVPQIPAYLLWHGAVLTAWFAGLFVQVLLVETRRTSLHRQLGWMLAGIGIAVVAISAYVTLNFVPRQSGLGVDIGSRIGSLSETVWTNLSQLVAFSGLLIAGVLLRRRPEWHKRFMVLASIGIVTPALSSSRLGSVIPMFRDGLGPLTPGSLRLAMLLLLVAGVALYDAFSSKRIHPATLVGGAIVVGARLIGASAIAQSEFGRSFILGLQ